jgi:RNA polymerase sigma-70 factor (sigma-E family)
LVTSADADEAIAALFAEHARSLVRLARLFADDRNAAEDLVQEAFLRLRRSFHRIESPDRTAAYLRSIVLNLARDHNRRGLMSLRHRMPEEESRLSAVDRIVMREDQQQVIEALRALPRRQRDCVTLRYYLDLSIADIAMTLGISVNSVKTHLQRGMTVLETRLETTP